MATIIGAKATQRSVAAIRLRRRIGTAMTAAAMGRFLAAAAAGVARRRRSRLATPYASTAVVEDVKS